MRRWLAFVALSTSIACSQPAAAFDLGFSDVLPSASFALNPYFGAGLSKTHHTGYDRDRPVSLEQWEFSGKLLAGAFYAKRAAIEIAYYRLGTSPFFGGPGKETSNAVAASVLWFTPMLVPNWFPMRLYIRGGAGYKWISDNNGAGLIQREDGIAYLIGGGLDVPITNAWAARIEYEYMSKIGTRQAVNVQHTPISLTVYYRLPPH